MKQIPVIDLFAGPGGLAEGFSSVRNKNERAFKIKLSIEKDENAHKTLMLRSFCRQFSIGSLPKEYYDVVKAETIAERTEKIEILYQIYAEQAKAAEQEAWNCELGSKKFSSESVDKRIQEELKGTKEWVLIGGPPCQAYSMAGRSRVGGINPEDHRVYLYKEYLRIIAYHNPAVFVMENVKGLLSAEVDGEKVFDWIKRDLQNPSTVFSGTEAVKYKVFSLSTPFESIDEEGNPVYKDDKDYLIKSEEYSVPQKRHRVILLGIREDIDMMHGSILQKADKQQALADIIGDLPKIRSGLSKEYLNSKIIEKDGKKKKKRIYKPLENSDENWNMIFKQHYHELGKWSDIDFNDTDSETKSMNIGAEFVECSNTIKSEHQLASWFIDEKLSGVPNHESRSHLKQDLKRYMFSAMYAKKHGAFPRMSDYEKHNRELLPDHGSATSGKFADRFRVQMPDIPATTVTSHISKDGHYFIHYDERQCRSLTVREAARIQTFPDNYVFCGSRTAQYHQVGNAVPPYLAYQIAHIVKDIFNNNI